MEASVGRGQSVPSLPVRRPGEGRRHADACTGASLPPPVTMHLDCQGPPVSYSEAASRQPQRATTSPDELEVCDMQVKIMAHEKEKEATRATLNWIQKQEWDKQAALRKEKEHELQRACQCEAKHKLAKEGAWWQEEYKSRVKGLWSLSLIPSLIPWDGVNMSGPGRTSMRVPHGLETYGVPAPWTTSNWP